jgi:hypothetical protein
MTLSRRQAIKLLGVSAASLLTAGGSSAGPATMPLPRMPLEEFVQSRRLVAALRRGVRAMKRRKPSDPLSWFYQAAIHAVTPDAIGKAAAQDPGVGGVFQKRYWNQCPHFGENSANFLPWHRAYTYHFEKILRMHTEEEDDFSLPYWNYTEKSNRKFPKEFGIEHLDGNLSNNDPDNINPLYLKERDYYFTGYEHPFATGLPLLELSDMAVDITLPMNAEVFFGETEREGLGGGIADEDPSTRGLLESYPHDQIHRTVGGIIGDTVGAMATPPTAAFDPVFWVHHSNIDRLWAEWACKPGKKWGKLPSSYWFNERAWFFYDVDGKVVNEPRKAYFDYRALGIRFKYEDPDCKPLTLPDVMKTPLANLVATVKAVTVVAEGPKSFTVLSAQRSVVPVGKEMRQRLNEPLKAMKARANGGNAAQRLVLRLQGVQLGTVQGTGFDVHLTTNPNAELTRADKSFVGSIALFRHGHHGAADHQHMGGVADEMTESFDISNVAAAIDNAKLEGLSVVLVPYALLTTAGKSAMFLSPGSLNVGKVDFLLLE